MSYEPYTSIISQGLAKRRQQPDSVRPHPEHKAPHYVVAFCGDLANAIGKAGAASVSLAQVLRLEATCTGSDYVEKLALRCHGLATSTR